MRKLLVMAVMTFLAGCSSAPKDIESLKRENYKDSFRVNQNYQQTYLNFKNGFSKCGGLEPSWTKPVSVDTELFTELNEGRITLNLVPAVGQQRPINLIKIKKYSDKQSDVTIYHRGQHELDNSKQIYRRWADGDLVCE